MQVHHNLNQLPPWEKTVLTIGSFDGVHTGHRAILGRLVQEARDIGGQSVLITFEPHPRLILGKVKQGEFYLINTLDEKISQLEETGLDHLVIVPFDLAFSSMTAEAYLSDFLLKLFHPHTILIGYDHRYGNDRSGGIEQMRAFAEGAGVHLIEILAQEVDAIVVSSTKVRTAVMAGDMEHASKLLGAPFQVSGLVVEGDKIGRTIGYPTANIALSSPYKLLPPHGIYTCTCEVAGKPYRALLYIGNRPSLHGEAELRIEAHLLDFSDNLYGKYLYVNILCRIRGDMTFSGLEALRTQIDADKQAALAWFEQAKLETAPSMADVAIVILNYNTEQHLKTFLPSVIAYSKGARIIVADNGSPDGSIGYLRAQHPDIEVIDLGINHGFAGGYNEALQQVQAEYYVILNSDVEVTQGWLDAPMQALRSKPNVAIVQPKIKAWRKKTHFEYAGAAGGWVDVLAYPFCRGRIFTTTEPDQGQYDTEHECFWAAGAAFFIRAKLYHAFGGFDADYFAHNEEIDLCWRIKRAGYQVLCTPKSVVYHLGGGTLEYESPRKVFLNFRNSLFTLLKNASLGHLIWAIPARLALDGVAGVRFLVKGELKALWAILQAHFSFYGQLSSTWRKRKEQEHIIRNQAIAPPNLTGMARYSVVWRFYLLGKKVF